MSADELRTAPDQQEGTALLERGQLEAVSRGSPGRTDSRLGQHDAHRKWTESEVVPAVSLRL